MITKDAAAQKLASYLRHEITLEQLVDWAENALLENEFEEGDAVALRTVIARLGLADVREFGLAWEDCEALLESLGYTARVVITTA